MITTSVDRKEEILEVATELLQTRSFSSFSYADLSARLGISKASIHHHFPTKEAMARALVERFRESYRRLLGDLDRQTQGPVAAPGDVPWRHVPHGGLGVQDLPDGVPASRAQRDR